MRPWIAMAAAYALALQVLLGGILATKAEAIGVSPDSPFVVCLGNDSAAAPPDHGDTGKAPAKHLQCVLCTLAKSSYAIVAAGDGTAREVKQRATVVFPISERIARFHSPTGHYQRGPPAIMIG